MDSCELCDEENGWYVNFIDYSCYQCPFREYYDNTNQTCYSCIGNCLECSAGYSCDVCYQGYTAFPIDTNNDSYCALCPAGCDTCVSTDMTDPTVAYLNCTECSTNFTNYNGFCLTTTNNCSTSEYWDQPSTSC